MKERELPEADDDFAQIASQFDTIGEMKDDLRTQLAQQKSFGQGAEARDKLLAAMLEQVEIPVPDSLIEGEVHRHLENEDRLEDDAHRAEVTESTTTTFRNQIFLDALAEKEEVKVSQDELTQYLIQGAQQYNMEPGEFIKILDQNGQIPGMVGEVARSKALSVALSKVSVVDSKGKPVDLTAFTAAATAPVADEHDGHDHAGDDHEGHELFSGENGIRQIEFTLGGSSPENARHPLSGALKAELVNVGGKRRKAHGLRDHDTLH